MESIIHENFMIGYETETPNVISNYSSVNNLLETEFKFSQNKDNFVLLRKENKLYLEIGYYKEPILIRKIVFSDYNFEKIEGKWFPTKCEISLELDDKLHERISNYIEMSKEKTILIKSQETILEILKF